MNRRFELTEVGADVEALRSEDRPGILFDLGFGLLQVDAFVRTSDPAVASALRWHVGKSVFATDSGAMAVILDAKPSSCFCQQRGSRGGLPGNSAAQREESLKVRTRMFCPSSLHMAGRILQMSHCQAIGCRAPIAIRPTLSVTAMAAAVRLTLAVILPFRRC